MTEIRLSHATVRFHEGTRSAEERMKALEESMQRFFREIEKQKAETKQEE